MFRRTRRRAAMPVPGSAAETAAQDAGETPALPAGRFAIGRTLAGWCAVGVAAALLAAQPPMPPKVVTVQEPPPAAKPSNGVRLECQPVRLIAPEPYQVPLILRPLWQMDVVALRDGVVDKVEMTPGKTVAEQAEVVRFDPKDAQLALDEARARLKAAQAALRLETAGGDKDRTERAQAAAQAAKADFDVAMLNVQRGSLRTPRGGQVFAVRVVPGQLVRRGRTLAVLGDTTRLTAEVPVRRTAVKPGDTLVLHQGTRAINARVEAVRPLSEELRPLAQLLDAAASAIVVIDNADGTLGAGQRIDSPNIPRQTLAAVPAAAIEKRSDGSTRVQVLRGGVVRDIVVQLFGPAGTKTVYVSGPFQPADQIITSTSKPLSDGTRLAAVPPPKPTPPTPRTSPAPNKPGPRSTPF